jgi:glycosyltransferase involved in cell wall biosynthesis
MPYARHGISVIEDPYESDHASEPRLRPGPVLRLAWFGQFAAPLRPFIEGELAAIARGLAGKPAELAFVTHASQAALVEEMASALREVNAHFSVRHVPWSVQATAHELARADIVVLPQDAQADWGRVKSHNRLVETIRAGRYAVASPIPAYLELAGYAGIGGDLAAELDWALANPAEALRRISLGQTYVAQRFAPARIADEWARVLEL